MAGKPFNEGVRRVQVITLSSLVEGGNLKDIKNFMSEFNPEERALIANAKWNGDTALFTASNNGHTDIVRYFLEQCDANTEIKGNHFVKEDGDSKHSVTALWSAAIRGREDLVQLLLEYGADVNGCSDSESTAVRAACYANQTDMVKLLVERGADINKPNIYGATCLMNAIESVELSEFLIKSGAEVNAQENKRDQLTALHYAVNYKNIDSIKVLLASGADINIKTVDGISPIMLAALLNLDSIVSFFLQATLPIPKEEEIHALEILGTKSVDYVRYNTAKSWWHSALELREQYNIPKTCLERRELFENVQEFMTSTELDNLDSTPKTMILQSLLMKERILGRFDNPDVLLCVLQYAFELQMACRYTEAFKVLLPCYDGFVERKCYLYDNCIVTVAQILTIANLIETENRGNGGEIKLDIRKAMSCLLEKLVDHVKLVTEKDFQGKLRNKLKNEDKRNFLQLMLLILDTFLLNVWMWECEIPSSVFMTVKRLIELDPRVVTGDSLLHIAVSRERRCFKRLYDFTMDTVSPMYETCCIKLLLEAGADVHSLDDLGCRPLHGFMKAIKKNQFNSVLEQRLHLLLDFGAHLDSMNVNETTPMKMMKGKNVDFDFSKYISLKCLAARTINEEGIVYKDEVPSCLINFLHIHETPVVKDTDADVVFHQPVAESH